MTTAVAEAPDSHGLRQNWLACGLVILLSASVALAIHIPNYLHQDVAFLTWTADQVMRGAVFGREGGERALGVGRVAVAKDSHACAREGRAIRDRKRGRVVEHDRVPGAGKGGEDGRERGEVVAKEKEKGVGFR